MSTPPGAAVGAALPDVAPRLRELRRRRGLTLEAAAPRAGLSPAHLSRLETGRRQPSLPMLLALARIYGTTVGELLGELAPERDPIIRGGGREPAAADGWTYHRAGGPGRAMQALRLVVPYGTQGDLVRVHPGEEWLYVLTGPLRLTLGETVHDLAPGDSAHFDSYPAPHRGGHARGDRAAVRPHAAAEPGPSPPRMTPSTTRKAVMSEMNEERTFPRGLVIRLFAYLVAGHLFAGFLYLLFTLGGQNQ